MTTQRTRLERVKPKKDTRWHREPCLAAGCPRAGTAGLCDAHRRTVKADAQADLAAVGVSMEIRNVTVVGGYVTITPHGGRPRGVHRFVMEALLGRDFYPGENVHHKNGVRFDNSPENLELWITSQPSGQRPADLVHWAHAILDRYDLGGEADRAAAEASKNRHPCRWPRD